MIQKITMTGVKTAKSVATHSKPINAVREFAEKEIGSVKNAFEFPRLKRFLQEAKKELKGMIDKIKRTKELSKSPQKVISAYDNIDMNDLNAAKRLINNPKLPPRFKNELIKEIKFAEETINVKTDSYTCTAHSFLSSKIREAERYIEKYENSEAQIRKAGKSVGYGDIDSFSGELTEQGKHKINFKGHHDDLDFEDTISRQLSHERDTKLHDLDMADPYNEMMMGKHSSETIEHEESSLMETLRHNLEKGHNTEQGHDLSETISSNHDDLTDELFG